MDERPVVRRALVAAAPVNHGAGANLAGLELLDALAVDERLTHDDAVTIRRSLFQSLFPPTRRRRSAGAIGRVVQRVRESGWAFAAESGREDEDRAWERIGATRAFARGRVDPGRSRGTRQVAFSSTWRIGRTRPNPRFRIRGRGTPRRASA